MGVRCPAPNHCIPVQPLLTVAAKVDNSVNVVFEACAFENLVSDRSIAAGKCQSRLHVADGAE